MIALMIAYSYSSLRLVGLTLMTTSTADVPRSSIDNHPSIRMQALPRNQAAILTGQKHKARCNLARLTWPTHWRGAELILRVLLHRAWNQWSPDRARAYGIYTDPVRDLLIVEATGEGDDGAFAGSIIEQVGTTDVGVDRGIIDDCVARLHVCKGVF